MGLKVDKGLIFIWRQYILSLIVFYIANKNYFWYNLIIIIEEMYRMAARYSKKNRLEDFNYFLKNYDKIYKQYGHTFVVIKNKNVIGVYNNVAEALENTKEPIGSYILQECNGKESGYTSYISSFNLFKV